MKTHIIDTTIAPVLPFSGAEIIENITKGTVEFRPEDYELYLDDGQKGGKYIEGHELRKKLSGKKVVNAAFMDYMQTHPELVPDSWKKDSQGRTVYIYAWGTIFRDSGGDLYVRYWCWGDGALQPYYDWLDNHWDEQDPALVSASPKALSQPLDTSDLEARVRALETWRERVQQS